MHLVFIGAHPDDETSAGGTIAKYVDRGHKATIVVATRGGRGHWKTPSEELERIRTGEMEGAAEVLGADVVFLDHKDADVPAGDALREEFLADLDEAGIEKAVILSDSKTSPEQVWPSSSRHLTGS